MDAVATRWHWDTLPVRPLLRLFNQVLLSDLSCARRALRMRFLQLESLAEDLTHPHSLHSYCWRLGDRREPNLARLCNSILRFPLTIAGFPSEDDLVTAVLDDQAPDDYIAAIVFDHLDKVCQLHLHPPIQPFSSTLPGSNGSPPPLPPLPPDLAPVLLHGASCVRLENRRRPTRQSRRHPSQLPATRRRRRPRLLALRIPRPPGHPQSRLHSQRPRQSQPGQSIAARGSSISRPLLSSIQCKDARLRFGWSGFLSRPTERILCTPTRRSFCS